MGKETAEIRATQDAAEDLLEPVPGRSSQKNGKLGFPKSTVIRYFVGCITDETNRAELENIMTRSLSCAGELKNPGDIYVISETGTFDKDGCYQVAVKYLYLPE